MRRSGAHRTRPPLPRWVYVPAALGAAFVVLPLLAMAIKVDWPHFWSLITSTLVADRTAAEPAHSRGKHGIAACVLGVPMALVLARSDGADACALCGR